MIARRGFLRQLLGGVAFSLASGLNLSAAARARSPLVAAVVDVSHDTRPAIEQLVAIGVTTVIRYYSFYQRDYPTKRLQKAECDALLSAGCSIAVVWQYLSQSISRFAAPEAIGIADACLQQAKAVGQPRGSGIYFGVDCDLGLNASDARTLVAFFEYMKRRLGAADYRIGVYGSG